MNPTNKAFRYFLVMLVLVCFAITSRAQTSSDVDQSFVETIVNKMAIAYQIRETPEQIRLQFEQNPLQLPTKTNKQMLQQFDDAYTSKTLLKNFKNALRQEMTDHYQQELSHWLNSEQAQYVTDARQFYYTLQGKRQQVITRYEMDQNPPSDQRINLISTLTDATSIVESSVESSVIIFKSIIKASGQLSEQRSFDDAQINAIANNFRSQIQAQAGNQLNQQQQVMYHHLPDETLNKYISFWGTDTGQWLGQTISHSMQAAYQQAADRFLESVKN